MDMNHENVEEKKSSSICPISVYREDFVNTSVKRPNPITQQPDFPDIIAGPFIDPLLPDSKISEHKPGDWEKANDVYERVICKYPTLKKVALPDKINQSLLEGEYQTLDKSMYQMDYSNEGKSYEPIPKSSKYRACELDDTLPEDWALPMSTQRTAYREWKKLVPWTIMPAETFTPPESDLGISREEQRLLKVTTGKTEYEENISDIGEEIINYAFYGDVEILPHEYRKKTLTNN